MKRKCQVCERYYDPATVRSGVPQGLCSATCNVDRKRLRANDRASRRRVPPRAPRLLFTPSSRTWGDTDTRCRVCGAQPTDRAHVIPRSLAPNAGDGPPHIIGLCRKHHQQYDAGQLDVLPLLSVEEQAAAVTAAGGIVGAMRVITGQRAAA